MKLKVILALVLAVTVVVLGPVKANDFQFTPGDGSDIGDDYDNSTVNNETTADDEQDDSSGDGDETSSGSYYIYDSKCVVLELPEKTRSAMLAQIPLGHPADAAEVAAAVSFLASDRAAYITGQVLHVNGGMYM